MQLKNYKKSSECIKERLRVKLKERLKAKLQEKYSFNFALIFFVTLLLSLNISAKIKVAFIDTGFCPNNLKLNKNIILRKNLNIIKNKKRICQNIQMSRKFHGHFILKVFNNELNSNFLENNKIELFLIDIFDNNGYQKMSSWLKALKVLRKNNVDIIFSAVGLPIKLNIIKNQSIDQLFSKIPLVLSSGKVQRGITKETILFPQVLINRKNNNKILLIGDYFKGNQKNTFFRDQNLLNKKKISLFFPNRLKRFKFSGNSLALALSASALISKCSNLNELRSCILKNKVLIKDSIDHSSMWSF